MAKITFGAQLEKLMEVRDWIPADLSHRIYQDNGKNRNQIERWLKIGKEGPNDKRPQITDDRIEALAQAFELSYPDSMYLYGLAGKIPSTRTPSLAQITQSFDTLVSGLQDFPFPAYVLDSRLFRFWMVNSPTIALIGGYNRMLELANCSVFQLLFSPRFGITGLFGDSLRRIQIEQIRRFKALNILRRHEEFYMEYPERLRDKDGLTDEEYAVFEETWNAVSPDSRPSANYAAAADLAFDFGDQRIIFHLTAETVLDLGNLFSISWFNLWNREYEEVANLLFNSIGKQPCVKVWELPNINTSEMFM